MKEETKLQERIRALVSEPGYLPVKPKGLARKLRVGVENYEEFRSALKEMIRRGVLETDKKKAIRLAEARKQIVGVFRSTRMGGTVRPRPGQGTLLGEVLIKDRHVGDAATGDVVLVEIVKVPKSVKLPGSGRIVEVIERGASEFVGTYFIVGEESFVRVDGNVFREPIYVGDPGAKGARPNDKVVLEILRYPSAQMAGEGVVTEVLGARGKPGIDVLSVIRQFNLPDTFSEEVLEDAREQSAKFADAPIGTDRLDLTGATILTIDPVDARDFDDAISVDCDSRGHWRLGVHIADVSTFVTPNSPMDREARKRGTSVYLPGRVIPMLPELISNGLASLQEGHVRLTKTVFIDFDPEGRITGRAFHNSAIKNNRRLTYEQAQAVFDDPEENAAGLAPEIVALLGRMLTLSRILRTRRRQRGFLEMSMAEPILCYDGDGKIVGAKYAPDEESHHVIEEFMLTANEAVAAKLHEVGVPFLRRIHELPDPLKLKAFKEFVESIGLTLGDYQSRFELQRVLKEVADKPQKHAVHYAFLRSLKQAVYGPEEEGHYAIASDCYCHFTSPIRRYPDLVVHRLINHWIRHHKKGTSDTSLVLLGEHCSFTERRAEKAERELVKIKLLSYLENRIGDEMEMVITGVEEYGFYAQGVDFPAEGLVHVRTLTDDFYRYEPATHRLMGSRSGGSFQLGDRLRLVIFRVNQEARQLDLRLASKPTKQAPALPASRRKEKKKGKRRR